MTIQSGWTFYKASIKPFPWKQKHKPHWKNIDDPQNKDVYNKNLSRANRVLIDNGALWHGTVYSCMHSHHSLHNTSWKSLSFTMFKHQPIHHIFKANMSWYKYTNLGGRENAILMTSWIQLPDNCQVFYGVGRKLFRVHKKKLKKHVNGINGLLQLVE